MRQICPLIALLVVTCGPPGSDGPQGPGDDPTGMGQCVGTTCMNFCPTGTATTISGVVTAPNGIDPIPHAQVYVPRSLPEFPSEVACEICGDTRANAYVLTRTGADGGFTLGPLPTRAEQAPGETVTVIAQKGRFRKVVELPIAAPCQPNPQGDEVFRLPGRQEGASTIPRIAAVTGDYDAMECVLLRLGIEAGQFDLYAGARLEVEGFGTGGLAGFDELLGDPARLKTYNIVFLNCADNTFEGMLADATVKRTLLDYVASGGRLYVTDWSYDWLEQIPEFSPVIDYEPGASGGAPEAKNAAAGGLGGEVVEANVLDVDLQEWLRAVEARAREEIISDANTVTVGGFAGDWVQQYAVASDEQTTLWIDGDIDGASGRPLTATHDYQECGRWLYSSYHTARRAWGDPFNGGGDPVPFPTYCGTSGLTPQERILEYLILHVADCLQLD